MTGDREHGAGGFIGVWYGKWRREDARSLVNFLNTEQLESGEYFGVDVSQSITEPDMWKRVFSDERVVFFYSNSLVEEGIPAICISKIRKSSWSTSKTNSSNENKSL